METLGKKTIGYTIAAAIAILFSTVLTWIKETNPAVNTAMKNLLGHHWITHGVAVLLVFLVLGYLFSRIPSVRRTRGGLVTTLLIVSVLAGGLGLVVLFLTV